MARTSVAKLAFNRGLVSRLGLARADIKRLALAAQVHTNFMVHTLGSMMLRPGFEHLGRTRGDLQPFGIPFVFSISDKADIEITDSAMRVWIDDELVSRVAVSTAITNGSFDVDLSGWTDADEAGAVSSWFVGGRMGLVGSGSAYAIRRQQVAVAAADQNKEHGLHIIVNRGPLLLRVGSTSGTDDLINETELEAGVHSLAFTPTGASAWVEMKNRLQRVVLIDSCQIEAAGDMVVDAPWLAADLRKIRHDQSGDVIFVACDGYQQRRIERRATTSWSIVFYLPSDGPFRTVNTGTITITPSGLSGNIQLVASSPLFKTGHGTTVEHRGALWQITSNGQRVAATITAQNEFTSAIRVTGVDAGRVFTVVIDEDALGNATFTLQRSLESEDGPWTDVQSYPTDVGTPYDDTLDNQIAWYRLGVKTGDYVNGTHTVSLEYTSGSLTGVVRLTSVDSELIAQAEVLSALGGTSATDDWAEGAWSDYRGFPTSVGFHEGRLAWAGRDKVDASVSDAFDSFDPNFEGDAGPISRSIGSGPVDTIEWIVSLQRMLLGAQGAEFSVRSSSLDEPLTPTNFNMKAASTQGSAPVAAVRIDQSAMFVQRGGTRVYELAFGQSSIDYEATQLSALVPEIGQPGIVKMVVQRQPDTRVHFLRSDGTVAVLVFDKVEQVIAWIEIESDGEIEDAVVMPGDVGDEEDFVYYYVKRTVDGAVRRFKEKWAFEADCRGDQQLCMLADCFVTYTGAATTTITAAHLAGEQVVVWADGADIGTDDDGDLIYTLDSAGQATIPDAVTNYVVGLPYTAQWQSAKLVELMAQLGSTLTAPQIIKSLSLIMADIHPKGIQYGQDFDDLQDLPEIGSEGEVLDPDAVMEDYVLEPVAFPGQWSSDARICLQAKAPRPATVLAAIAEVEHNG